MDAVAPSTAPYPPFRGRGRPKGSGAMLTPTMKAELFECIANNLPEEMDLAHRLWSRDAVADLVEKVTGHRPGKTIIKKLLHEWHLVPPSPREHFRGGKRAEFDQWLSRNYAEVVRYSREFRMPIAWIGTHRLPRSQGTVIALTTNRGDFVFRVIRGKCQRDDLTGFIRRLPSGRFVILALTPVSNGFTKLDWHHLVPWKQDYRQVPGWFRGFTTKAALKPAKRPVYKKARLTREQRRAAADLQRRIAETTTMTLKAVAECKQQLPRDITDRPLARSLIRWALEKDDPVLLVRVIESQKHLLRFPPPREEEIPSLEAFWRERLSQPD